MIELRWLNVPAGSRNVGDHVSGIFINLAQHSVVRVLQYRQFVTKTDWKSGSMTNPDTYQAWSDWQDVPTVEET